MSAKNSKQKPKPPPRWRRHLVQAELELPAPSPPSLAFGPGDSQPVDEPDPQWWQRPIFVGGLAALAALLLVAATVALSTARHDRAAAIDAAARERTLTLRATTAERALRITPNPRSWSAAPDAVIAWPEPPELLELYLPVAYSEFTTFAIVVDKVDQGRVLVAQRVTPDSNRELRLSLNSSAFGPGEYRLRLQGYNWRGERIDVGWARLIVKAPR